MDIQRMLALVVGTLIVLTACTLPMPQTGGPPAVQPDDRPPRSTVTPTEQVPSAAVETAQPTTTERVRPTRTEPAPATLPTLGPATLTLDKNYFCNHGPGRNYLDIVDYPTGTVLPIIGTNGAGWWLVHIDDHRTHHTECWIGGGIVSGDISSLPIVAAGLFVPVHDGTNWSDIVYLDCEHLERYTWEFGGVSSGEYVATEPIMGFSVPTVKYEEWMPICPSFSP